MEARISSSGSHSPSLRKHPLLRFFHFYPPSHVTSAHSTYNTLYLSIRTGDLRFRLPLPNDPYTGLFNATAFGPVCPQQNVTYTIPDNIAPEARAVLEASGSSLTDAEDCE